MHRFLINLTSIFTHETALTKRIYGLDIIRSIVILLVLWLHSAHIVPVQFKQLISNATLIDPMSFFFVLSGYLISLMIMKLSSNGNIKARDLLIFYTKRLLRTLPVYYVVLLVLSAIQYLYNKNFELYDVSRYVFFMQNLNVNKIHFFLESWSMSIEVWFYIIYPLLIILIIYLNILSRKQLFLVLPLTIIVSVTIFRHFRYLDHPTFNEDYWLKNFRTPVVTAIDTLMYGALAAYVKFYFYSIWKDFKYIFLWLAIGINLILALVFIFNLTHLTSYFGSVFIYPVTCTVAALTLPFFSQIKIGQGKLYKLVTFISLISYSLYLVHAGIVMNFIINGQLMQIFAPAMKKYGVMIYAFNYLLYWFLSFCLAYLMYRFIEKPFMNLRHRLFKTNETIKIT